VAKTRCSDSGRSNRNSLPTVGSQCVRPQRTRFAVGWPDRRSLREPAGLRMAVGLALAKDWHGGGAPRWQAPLVIENQPRARRARSPARRHGSRSSSPGSSRACSATRWSSSACVSVIRRDPHLPHPRGAKIPAPTIAPTPRKIAPQTVICFGGDGLAVVVAAPMRVERSSCAGSDISLGYTTARESGSLMLEAARWTAAARRPTLPGLPSRRSGSCPFDRAESG